MHPQIPSNSARNCRFPHNSCKTLAKQMHKTIGKTAKIQHSHHTNSWKNHRKKARNSAHLPHNGIFCAPHETHAFPHKAHVPHPHVPVFAHAPRFERNGVDATNHSDNVWFHIVNRQCVRAAKEMDSKSIGLCPQGFESPRCRLHYLPFKITVNQRTAPTVAMPELFAQGMRMSLSFIFGARVLIV